MRSSPKRMPNSSSDEQVALAPRRVRHAPRHSAVELARAGARACRARPATTVAAAPWRRSPRWRACPRRVRSPARARSRSAAALARPRPRGRRVAGADLDAAARDRHRRRRLAPSLESRSRRAMRRDERRRRRRSRRCAPASTCARLHAGLVAPRAQRLHGLDHGGRSRPRPPRRAGSASARGDARRREQALRCRDVAPELLGDERDHRVRERERLAQHVEHVAGGPSSNSRPLISSRYQSHSSP